MNTYWELPYAIKQRIRDRMTNTASHITFFNYFAHGPFTFLLRWGSPAEQSGKNEGILFKLWRKEIPKIPNIFILFH